jgi:uncharacterized protein
MRPMPQLPREKGRPSGGFLAALLIGWIVLGAAGVVYARFKGIPNPAAVALLAAFLAEYPFYLVLAFPSLRERLGGARLPLVGLGVAVVPYLIACLGAAQFDWASVMRLAGLGLAIALWFRILPRHAITDLLFLAFYPVVLLGGFFGTIYIPAVPILRNQLIYLGHFTQIILTILTLMVGRRVAETGFGFLPTGREWRIGAAHYLIFVAVGLPLGLALHAVAWKRPAPVWTIAANFIAFLWVASLAEEFLVRGVLQAWLEKWTKSVGIALAISAIVFGLLHIGYRQFPNWQWVAVACVLGWCCGHARNQAGNIRAGVVTHALAVATWRAFFS